MTRRRSLQRSDSLWKASPIEQKRQTSFGYKELPTVEDTNMISYTSKILSSSFVLLSCIKLQSISSQHAPLSGKRCSDLSSWLRQEDQYDVEYLIILITRPHNIMIFVFSFSLFFLNYIMFSYRLLYCLIWLCSACEWAIHAFPTCLSISYPWQISNIPFPIHQPKGNSSIICLLACFATFHFASMCPCSKRQSKSWASGYSYPRCWCSTPFMQPAARALIIMCPRVPPQIAAAMISCHIEASLTVTSRNLDLKLRFKFRQRLEPNQSLTLTPPPTRPFRRFPIMSFHMSL